MNIFYNVDTRYTVLNDILGDSRYGEYLVFQCYNDQAYQNIKFF